MYNIISPKEGGNVATHSCSLLFGWLLFDCYYLSHFTLYSACFRENIHIHTRRRCIMNWSYVSRRFRPALPATNSIWLWTSRKDHRITIKKATTYSYWISFEMHKIRAPKHECWCWVLACPPCHIGIFFNGEFNLRWHYSAKYKIYLKTKTMNNLIDIIANSMAHRHQRSNQKQLDV